MTFTRLGIKRPDLTGLSDEQTEYVSAIEILARMSGVQEVRSSMDPRTWPMSTHLSLLGMVVIAFAWAFNSGGDWREMDRRVAAIELQEKQDAATYARRDVLEQQMNYVVTGLNELKAKVDQLTVAR